MKRIIIIALIVLITNLLVGLIVTAYSPLNLLFTSSAIVINGLLLALYTPFKSWFHIHCNWCLGISYRLLCTGTMGKQLVADRCRYAYFHTVYIVVLSSLLFKRSLIPKDGNKN